MAHMHGHVRAGSFSPLLWVIDEAIVHIYIAPGQRRERIALQERGRQETIEPNRCLSHKCY